ncbi:MAG: kelch motif-containing protein [Pseudomonadota bacterium]|nr:kelch motif-containing protein [Pseudomonadota bacterium]
MIGQGAFKSKEGWLDKDGRAFTPEEYFNLGGKTKWYGAILFLGVVVGAHLFYVRGMGVQPATSAPQTIERQGVARTYAWIQKAEMPTPRTEVTASVLNGKVYVIGGFDGFARTLATVEIYDPAADPLTRCFAEEC